MTNKNSSEELLNLLKENIGKAYNQDSIESFESYIEELINSDTKQIASRISMLFAYWSNIEYLFGDKVEASWESAPEIILLKEYKFSIANELAILCPEVISRDVGNQYRVETQDQFNLMVQILEKVDIFSREERKSDRDAAILLLEMIASQLFKIPPN
jgi:hypothetical protein